MIIFVAGTRPEIIKLYPIIRFLKNDKDVIVVWTGQHYDYELAGVFLEEFNNIKPDFDLRIGSIQQSAQIARIIEKLGDIISSYSNKGSKGIIVAVGDTNTVLGASIAASKTNWVFAHVEAGLRSFDRYMPEEINRVIADHIANVLFAPSVQATLNLLYEGIDPWRIWLTGNTIVDAIRIFMPKVEKLRDYILGQLNVEEPYALVTIHRAENVDHADRLYNILRGLKEVSKEINLVFPIHPRTKKRIKEFGLQQLLKGLKVIKPIGYIEFLSLLTRAQMVFTDSGGVQEEAFTLGIPCITLRRNTERPETVWLGGNILVGDDTRRIIEAYKHVSEHRKEIIKRIKSADNPYGDGKASERIAKVLRKLIEDKDFYKKISYNKDNEPDYRNSDYPIHIVIDGTIFEGMYIEDIHWLYPNVYVTLIYDEKGKPLIPYNDLVVKADWKLRIVGPKKTIENLLMRVIMK